MECIGIEPILHYALSIEDSTFPFSQHSNHMNYMIGL